MLINCVVYQEGRKLADIDFREIHSYLARPGCFVWVALKDATDAELEQMREEFDLHPLAVEDARHGAGALLVRRRGEARRRRGAERGPRAPPPPPPGGAPPPPRPPAAQDRG